MTRLDLISAGAARGVVEALSDRFQDASRAAIAGTFGAVGAMKERLLAGEPCDAVILTHELLGELAVSGYIESATIRRLGRVETGVAVRAGDAPVSVHDEPALRETLLVSIRCEILRTETLVRASIRNCVRTGTISIAAAD